MAELCSDVSADCFHHDGAVAALCAVSMFDLQTIMRRSAPSNMRGLRTQRHPNSDPLRLEDPRNVRMDCII